MEEFGLPGGGGLFLPQTVIEVPVCPALSTEY